LPTKKNPDTHSLEERLSRLDWPKAPEGVRERVLDQIMERFGDGGEGELRPDRPAPTDDPSG
jgi:hypothetical protein